MRASLNGSFYTVVAEIDDVQEFAKSWPCHGLNLDAEYTFEFSAKNGDIVDLSATEDGKPFDTSDSGAALSALSEDAGRYGAETLGLEDVLAIRFPASAPRR